MKVISFNGVEFEGEAQGFTVPTQSGEITILNYHRPLITLLKKGRAKIIKPDGAELSLSISGGFLEMSPHNELKVLIN